MRMVFVCLLLCGLQTSFAQKKQLMVGSKIPYDDKIQFATGSVILPELKGPLIIDLFSSNCIVCFQMMPKVNALQQQFKSELRFLLLGRLDDKIEGMYRKFEKRLNLQLDIAFDSGFFKRIDCRVLPTYIWVGRDSNIAAVTGPGEITADNIALFVAGKELPFGKNMELTPYDSYKPYLLYGNGGPDSNFYVRSVIGPWNPKLPYNLPPDTRFNQQGRSFNVLGVGLGHLYNYAYWGRIGWGVRDSLYGKAWLNPVVEAGGAWPPDKYCYSASYNGSRVPDLAIIMQKDLESFFGFETQIETRQMPCYILRLRRPGLLRSKMEKKMLDVNHAGFILKNRQVRHLREVLAYYDTTDIPFLDETGIDYPIDLTVDAVLTNQADFFAALQKQGILITEEKRPMKVLVLRPKNDVAAGK